MYSLGKQTQHKTEHRFKVPLDSLVRPAYEDVTDCFNSSGPRTFDYMW